MSRFLIFVAHSLVATFPVGRRKDLVRLEPDIIPETAQDGGVVFEEGDRVLGLDRGAGDYVGKPFSLRRVVRAGAGSAAP
jgi:hypothetical protein